MKYIDLRSDTVTQPTKEMRNAMATAVVGDDVFADDPTVNELEALAAGVMGKQAAVFVPSGSFGNQLAIMTHTARGDEIIVTSNSHIVVHELGAAGLLSGVNYAMAFNDNDFMYAKDIARLAQDENDVLAAHTGLVCLENALSNGDVVPLSVMQDAYKAAKERALPVHLDGARIFNAALALGVTAKELADNADSVMFCLSKGLCSPVGSMLCGSHEFIKKARKNRKRMGGALRQVGVLAACGLISLTNMVNRLEQDHINAKKLGEMLAQVEGISVLTEKIKINMVFFSFEKVNFSTERFVQHMYANGVKILGDDKGIFRFVTHNDVSLDDLQNVVRLVREYLK